MYYYIVDSIRNEGKDSFEINSQSGEVFTKQIFDRETKGAFALEVEARDGAPSARPNSGGKPNTGKKTQSLNSCVAPIDVTDLTVEICLDTGWATNNMAIGVGGTSEASIKEL